MRTRRGAGCKWTDAAGNWARTNAECPAVEDKMIECFMHEDNTFFLRMIISLVFFAAAVFPLLALLCVRDGPVLPGKVCPAATRLPPPSRPLHSARRSPN